MKRRQLLASAACLGTALCAPALLLAQERAHYWPLWEAWRNIHLEFSGRVVDGPQQRASHSEGQAYGMLLAAEAGDLDAFRRMIDWTDTNLAIRTDSLLAWRWLPDLPERVPDLNNASDGDLFFAWALLRAADRFGEAGWRDRAAEIARDLEAYCIVDRPDQPSAPLLLPARTGFVSESGVVVNPSYMMPRALREVGTATGEARLTAAARTGLDLMAQVAASRLVPDWLGLSPDGVGAAPGFSFDAGYEAIRIPLFLLWSGENSHPALRRAAAAMERAPQGQAATVMDGETGEILSLSPEPGYRAVAGLAACVASGQVGATIPPFRANQSYYPATLHLFSVLAQSRYQPSCVPI